VGNHSRQIGQHLVKARHANLPYNALPFLVTYVVSSAFNRRFGDYSSTWIALGVDELAMQHETETKTRPLPSRRRTDQFS